jgi:hypothetical protein
MRTSELQGAALATWDDVKGLEVPFTLYEVVTCYTNDVFARCEVHPIKVTRCGVMEGTGATLPSISFTSSDGRRALGSIADYYLTKEAADVDAAVSMAGGEYWDGYTPSTDWAQGGPIIEREKIQPAYCRAITEWRAEHYSNPAIQYGTTPLIAAMRCYVASKMGDEVEIPKEV